jgi:hypothetical protein
MVDASSPLLLPSTSSSPSLQTQKEKKKKITTKTQAKHELHTNQWRSEDFLSWIIVLVGLLSHF